jgi:hypothetical protein
MHDIDFTNIAQTTQNDGKHKSAQFCDLCDHRASLLLPSMYGAN